MNYEQFISAMLDCTQNKLQGEKTVERQEVLKNNGVVLVGLTIKEPEKVVAPVIYLEEYYKRYLNGASIEGLAECLLERSKHTPEVFEWEKEKLFDFEQMKGNIIYKLVNTEENEKLLSEVPNLPVLDFSIVFYLHLPISENESGSILIRNAHMEVWKCSISLLYKLARENTPKLCPPVLCSLTDFLKGYGAYMEEECPVMVLTNENGLYGASVLLYPKMPELIYKAVGGSYYLLPSSVHEFLVVPEENGIESEELTSIVREVNRTEIEEEEFLSDEVYYFAGDIITKM